MTIKFAISANSQEIAEGVAGHTPRERRGKGME